MKDSKKTVQRKTGSLIAKNIIILLVLVAVCVFSIWSWFTNGQTSYANGILLKSKADGVEISWDGEDYYKHLTAMTDSEVVSGQTGLAKNISGEDGVPTSLGLVTGNGLDFFAPVINRRTGDVLINGDGTWKGSVVEDGTGKYIDVDLYFRAMSPHSIYLAGDSRVSPKNPDGNPSDYGNFSKDYIAAASRVAFLNADKTACSWIWAPNADIELQESQDGYKKLTETTEDIPLGGGGGIPAEILLNNSDNKNYNLWLPNDYNEDRDAQLNGMKLEDTAEYVKYDGNKGLFVFEFPITFYRANQTIPFIINENSTLTGTDISKYITPTQGVAHKYNDASDPNPTVQFSNGTYNVTESDGYTTYKTYGIYFAGFKTGTTINVKMGYNPDKKELIVIEYQGESQDGVYKEYDRTTPATQQISCYNIPENETLALASEAEKMAVTSLDALEKPVSFKSAGTIRPSSISSAEQFTVKKTGDRADATYVFLNSKDRTYLKADKNGIAFVANESSATVFKLAAIAGFDGAVLQTNDGQYLAYTNGRFRLVSPSKLTSGNFVTVYLGTSYELDTASTALQDYTFYRSGTTSLTSLSANSTPPLFTSLTTDTASKKIGLVDANNKYPVATLTKEANSDYYTAHIVVRIWVEGTDRDALQPLANGLFNLDLHFVPEK